MVTSYIEQKLKNRWKKNFLVLKWYYTRTISPRFSNFKRLTEMVFSIEETPGNYFLLQKRQKMIFFIEETPGNYFFKRRNTRKWFFKEETPGNYFAKRRNTWKCLFLKKKHQELFIEERSGNHFYIEETPLNILL